MHSPPTSASTVLIIGIENPHSACIFSRSDSNARGSSFIPPNSEFQNVGAVPNLDDASRTPSASAEVGTSGLSNR